MAKANLKLIIDMNIDLPEGEIEITEKEKSAIIDRIHGYLTNLGTTSDDYDGSLSGKLGKYGPEFELTVSEIPQPNPEQIKFLENPSCCPHCGSDDVSGGEIELNAGSAFQNIQCNECESNWNEIYTLVGFGELKI